MNSARNAQGEWTGEGLSQSGCDHPKFADEKAQPELGEGMHSRVQSASSRAFLQSNNRRQKDSSLTCTIG